MELGELVRTLRQAQRLTLAELAKRSGIDQATLSRIETGKMTGTVESHRAIAQAMGLRLAELYAKWEDDRGVRQAVSVQTAPAPEQVTTYAPGKASWQVLTTQVLHKKMLPALLTLEPRGHTQTETLPPGTERFLYVLEGEVAVKLKHQRYPLKARQTAYFDAHLPHQLLNPAGRPARCLSVLTPAVV